MKEILVALLVLLQLVLLSEGAWHKLLKPSKLWKICLRNPKLEAWKKKALSLATKRDREKRHLATGFPVNCVIFGFLELEDGYFLYYPLSKCCIKCHKMFENCTEHHDLLLCMSRAHTCTCECREKHMAVLQTPAHTSASICKKSTCGADKIFGTCCVVNQCVKLKVRKYPIISSKERPVRANVSLSSSG